MAHSLKIISMNCRGIRDVSKRRDVLHYLRQKDANVICLQDTHLMAGEVNEVRSQWGYECILSGCKRDARGVAILFQNNFQYKMLEQKADQDGNFLIAKIDVNENIFTIVNIYGPNQDSPKNSMKI